MRNMFLKTGLAVLALATLAGRADAATAWVVEPEGSGLGWTATFNGQGVSGVFGNWSADVAFDAADLKGSHVKVSVQLASVDSGDDERDGTLKGADFFNVAQTPVAVFDSTDIRKAPHGYVAVGTLTMAGVQQPVTLPFDVTVTGDKAEAHGRLRLSRKASGIGKGNWQDASQIGDAVDVDFHVKAHAKP